MCEANELIVRSTGASIVVSHLQQLDIFVLTENELDWSGSLIGIIIIKESNFCYPIVAENKRSLSEKLVRKMNEFKSTFMKSTIRMVWYKSSSGLNLNEFFDENRGTRACQTFKIPKHQHDRKNVNIIKS